MDCSFALPQANGVYTMPAPIPFGVSESAASAAVEANDPAPEAVTQRCRSRGLLLRYEPDERGGHWKTSQRQRDRAARACLAGAFGPRPVRLLRVFHDSRDRFENPASLRPRRCSQSSGFSHALVSPLYRRSDQFRVANFSKYSANNLLVCPQRVMNVVALLSGRKGEPRK